MIFEPDPLDCITYNRVNKNLIYICYPYKGKYIIEFDWHLNVERDKEIDPFYLTVTSCMHDSVLRCTYLSCNCLPQLRYNDIIKKWFCNCSSSAICTKNTDESEMEELLNPIKKFDKIHGFCDNPIEAILKWNELQARDYLYIAKENLKAFNKKQDKRDYF